MTIDWWTLGLQTVNVLILVWLLGHFFWRPVAAMIEQRRTTAQKALADAAAERAEAAAALADIERTRSGFAQERDALLKAAQETVERAHAARLQEAEKEAATLEAAAKAAIARNKDAAEKAWAERASHLAVDIARRLAARLDGPAVRTVFLEWLLKEIHNLPDTARQAVAAGGGMLEAISAALLEPADQQRYSKLIMEAFGANLPIAFKVDPNLIAGLELHGPHLIIANSWRADLTQILADIAHDDRS
jgi:F-type H+-transporting ATPase subunit b